MWPNPQKIADLVTFTEEILNRKLHFFVRCLSSVVIIIPREEQKYYYFLTLFGLGSCYFDGTFIGTDFQDFLRISDWPRYLVPMKSYFFWHPWKLINTKIFQNLFVSPNVIPVLAKKMLLFVNKCKIQFK